MDLDRAGIEALLPHRDPFLLVDRATIVEKGVEARGEHDVSPDAFWVPGHFPQEAVMPGVLIAEAMAQVAALAVLSGMEGEAMPAVYLVGYDKLRFRKPVRPGDTLVLTAKLERERRGLVTLAAEARVNDEKVANGTLMAAASKG